MIKLFPGVKTKQRLKPDTTFKIGGPAEYFYEAVTTDDLIKAVVWGRNHHLTITILGNASNVLISDQGIKGLVIKNKTEKIELLGQARARLDSGVFLPKAIYWLINQGLTGLEVFSGIPASVGGATYMNLHGAGNCYWSDFFLEGEILTADNRRQTVKADYFNFAYDYSGLQRGKDILLTATLQLQRGNKLSALSLAKEWAKKKAFQPQRSAGCIFQNLPDGRSVGEIIDKQLGLKGKRIGEAKISEKHANFIENLGSAKASDVLQLIKLIKTTAKNQLGIDLKLEIALLGFKEL